MHLKKVSIENIKSIKKLELTFPEPAGWHVIIGDNGTGKSSILKAIALGLIGPNGIPALSLNLNNFINYHQKKGSIGLKLEFDEIDIIRLPKRYNNLFDFQHEILSLGIQIEKEEAVDYINVKSINPRTHQAVKNFFWRSNSRGFFSASFGPFRRFTGGNREWQKVFYSNPKTAAHLTVFGEGIALTEALEWLIKLNYQKLENSKTAKDTLIYLTNFINDSDLLPHNVKIVEINSSGVFVQDDDTTKINVNELSDGFRSILSMTFEIIRQLIELFGGYFHINYIKKNKYIIDIEGVILIDEIDAHLHPSWQTTIGKWFTKYFPKMQFIVTTHSPLICRASEKGSIWQLAKPGSNEEAREITGNDKQKLIVGNILDAYGTELFGASPVRSAESDAKLKRLGQLNMLYAIGKIDEAGEKERRELQKILTTDDPTGF